MPPRSNPPKANLGADVCSDTYQNALNNCKPEIQRSLKRIKSSEIGQNYFIAAVVGVWLVTFWFILGRRCWDAPAIPVVGAAVAIPVLEPGGEDR